MAQAIGDLEGVEVAEIDPALADTAAFCERYGVDMDESANCVIVAASGVGEVRYAACMVLATARADVNGVVRRHLDARKIVVRAAGRTRSGSPGWSTAGSLRWGCPRGWPVLVDEAVANHPGVVIGSGVRHSKLALSGAVLAGLKTAEVLRLATVKPK